MFTSIMKLLKNEDGATAIEYGLIAALIAVAAIAGMTAVGTKLSTTFNSISASSKLRRKSNARRHRGAAGRFSFPEPDLMG